jgi:NitT/TauT family transport system substrate-binding protein
MRKLIPIYIILLLALVACAPEQAAAESSESLIPVTIHHGELHDYSIAVLHVAVENGYFAEQGLDVTLVEKHEEHDEEHADEQTTATDSLASIEAVQSGEAGFGIATATDLIQAAAAGAPVVAVANFLQRSPLAVISVNASIRHPLDLVGRTVSVANIVEQKLLESLLVSQSIDLPTVTIQVNPDMSVADLTAGTVDALVGSRISLGIELEEQGLTPSFIMFSDFGVETYDLVLFTTQIAVREQQNIVQSVVNAVHFALDFTGEDASAAIEYTLAVHPELDFDAQLVRLESAIPLMTIADVSHLSMEETIWRNSYRILRDGGLVMGDLDLPSLYTTVFAEASEDLR